MISEKAIQHLQTIKIYSLQDGYTDEAREAIDMAIEVLKKQIPADPVEGYMFRENLRKKLKKTWFRDKPWKADERGTCCPTCGDFVGDMVFLDKDFFYCNWCGQAIKCGGQDDEDE